MGTFHDRYQAQAAHNRRRRLRALAGAALVILIAGGAWWVWWGGGPMSPQAAVDRQERAWRAQSIADYDWTYTAGTYWSFNGLVTVSVRNGDVVSISHDEPEWPEQEVSELTVAEVFRRLHDGLGADEAEWRFDPRWCVPEAVYLDYDAGVADEEWSFRLHDFTPVGTPNGCGEGRP